MVQLITKVFLTTYDGAAGLRANKKDFVIKHDEVPVYAKTFNPSGTISTTTSTININSHFFNDNEELTYTPDSTFIGIAGYCNFNRFDSKYCRSCNNIITKHCLCKSIDENQFQLFTRPEYVASGNPVTFTGIGGGNAHKLIMRKALNKNN